MKKLFVCLAAVSVLTGVAFAAGGEPSEAGISTSPLKIWSTGVGGGFLYPLNTEFKDSCGGAFGKIIWTNSFDFTDNIALFADFNWYIGNSLGNGGADLGVEYTCLPCERVKPFLGVGAGAHYFHRESAKDDISKAFGGSATVRVGVSLALTNTVDVKIRVPFHAVFTQTADMGVGVDLCVMFYNSLRHVKSVDY
jgi:hypothetical protein